LQDLQEYEKSISEKPLVCLRCHQLSSYGKAITCDVSAEDFYSSLGKLKEKKVLIVKIIDLFDVEGSFIPNFNELIGDNPILLVGNKVDLLPTGVVYERIESYLKYVAYSVKLMNIKGIQLVSGAKGINMKNFGAKMERIRHFRDVYVVGRSNVGKSTLINRMVSAFSDRDKSGGNIPHMKAIRRLTESSLPGTTLKTISFRIGRGYKKASSYLFDTPGVMNPNLASNYLQPSEWKFAYPKNKIVPKHYRVKPGKTLFIGGMFRIDYVSSDAKDEYQRSMITLFVSTYTPIHTTRTERADEIYKTGLGKILFPPNPENQNLTPMVFKKTFKFNGLTRKESIADICISGMGWISITGVGEMEFNVYAPEKLDVYERKPIMPHEVFNIDKSEFRDV
jgi:30S ribosome assembly GTPase